MEQTINPAFVFPAATPRGGVEQAVWQALRYFGPRYPTRFVGYELAAPERVAVSHIVPDCPAWATGALAPLGFRVAARRAVPRGRNSISISFGVNAPPGDVLVVNSLHRTWLRVGGRASWHGHQIPNAVRYALPRHQVLLGLEREYFTRSHPRAVIAVSHTVAAELCDLYGVNPAHITVIPNGFDPDVCSPARRVTLRNERRSECGIHDDAIAVLFVANELHRKGFGVLLEAVARLDDDRVEIHVVGRTDLRDYASRIDELGLAGRVAHHGTTADIGLFHAIADLLVLPTQYEAFALTIVEALASGLPVVTTGVPGAGDLVTPGVNGLLQHDPTDAEELRDLLRQGADVDRRASWAAHAPHAVAGLEWASLMARYASVVHDHT